MKFEYVIDKDICIKYDIGCDVEDKIDEECKEFNSWIESEIKSIDNLILKVSTVIGSFEQLYLKTE